MERLGKRGEIIKLRGRGCRGVILNSATIGFRFPKVGFSTFYPRGINSEICIPPGS